MRNKLIAGGIIGTFLVISALMLTNCNQTKAVSAAERIEKGRSLVTIGGCNDCHTAKIFTEQGIELDSTMLLAGHPADDQLPAVPADIVGPGKWGAVGNAHFTAWYGPWGTSYAANLTPDMATGSGAWTETAFVKAMRNGKHLGAGRPILPPMPWPNLALASDDDLKTIFAYLHSLKPVKNMVPQPQPPEMKVASK